MYGTVVYPGEVWMRTGSPSTNLIPHELADKEDFVILVVKVGEHTAQVVPIFNRRRELRDQVKLGLMVEIEIEAFISSVFFIKLTYLELTRVDILSSPPLIMWPPRAMYTVEVEAMFIFGKGIHEIVIGMKNLQVVFYERSPEHTHLSPDDQYNFIDEVFRKELYCQFDAAFSRLLHAALLAKNRHLQPANSVATS